MTSETWRSVESWTGFYEVSNLGRVRSLTRTVQHRRNGLTEYQGRLLRPGYSTGYAVVNFVDTRNDRREQYYVHDLVLKAFIGPKPPGLEVCHGPLGECINTLDNLRYDTRRANALDRYTFGKGVTRVFDRRAPTRVECIICSIEISITRRRNAPIHVCNRPKCRSELGRLAQKRSKERERFLQEGY